MIQGLGRLLGTLIEGSKLLPNVPVGAARALLALSLVSEVHPFTDGNGRLARLVMNAELAKTERPDQTRPN